MPGASPAWPAGMQIVRSPVVHADKTVTFRLYAPDARQVVLDGNWEGGDAIKMTEDAHTGIWSATVGPLPEQLLGYDFSVDGVSALDPAQGETQRDNQSYFSLVLIPRPHSAEWTFADVPHGTVEAIWYPSPALKEERRMMVYLPPGYETSTARYPVLYLLHGATEDEEAWINMGRANVILDNLIAQRRIRPIIVVMTNGNADQVVAQGRGYGPIPPPQAMPVLAPLPGRRPPTPFRMGAPPPQSCWQGSFSQSVLRDVIPFVERTFRVERSESDRAIAGLSAGGAETVVISNHAPGEFGYVGAFSPGINLPGALLAQRLAAQKAAGIRYYWIGAGLQDIAHPYATKLATAVKRAGIPTTYREIPGRHDWFIWRDFLVHFLGVAFKR